METIFTRAIGNTPKIKVLEFLIEGRELDYSISDIAEGAGIGRTTLFRAWNDLIELGIVKNTRNKVKLTTKFHTLLGYDPPNQISQRHK